MKFDQIELIEIDGGTFTMGASQRESGSCYDERPQHKVTLQPFCLGRYPITQAQWRVVAGYDRIEQDLDPDPSNHTGHDRRPVENVSWKDAQEFCKRLSVATGKDYRLPSEAQWEYACRAGTTTPYHFGETISRGVANGPDGPSRDKTTVVGSYPANDWGLHDMHGNVWEWCEDDWHDGYDGAPDNGSAWVDSDREETHRLLRGGSWHAFPQYCRSAVRTAAARDSRDDVIGFRVCCVPLVGLSR